MSPVAHLPENLIGAGVSLPSDNNDLARARHNDCRFLVTVSVRPRVEWSEIIPAHAGESVTKSVIVSTYGLADIIEFCETGRAVLPVTRITEAACAGVIRALGGTRRMFG